MSARIRLNISLCCGHTNWCIQTFKVNCFNIQKLAFARGLCLFISYDFEKNVMIKVKCHTRTGHDGLPVAQLVEALRYKPEGRGFDSRWCHWIFSLT
jgi:hypothetical protein